MTTPQVALLAKARAARWLQGAQRALEDRRWDDAVYAAQMSSEHAAKAVLLARGIEVPKQHDVSEVFVILAEREDVPAALQRQVPQVADMLAELAAQRAEAGYGFEIGLDVAHFEETAPEAVEKGKAVLRFAEVFFRRDQRGSRP